MVQLPRRGDPAPEFVRQIYSALLNQGRNPNEKYRLGRAMMLLSEKGDGTDSVIIRDLTFPPSVFGTALDAACLSFAKEMGTRVQQRVGLYHFRMLSALGLYVGGLQFHTQAAPERGHPTAESRIATAGVMTGHVVAPKGVPLDQKQRELVQKIDRNWHDREGLLRRF